MSVRGFNTGSGVEQYDYEYLDNKPEIPTKKSDIGLGNVDNTSDLDKPISNATQTALNEKVPNSRKVNGKELSADVTLTSGDIGYDASTAYGSGTVGEKLTHLNRQINDLNDDIGNVDYSLWDDGYFDNNGNIIAATGNIEKYTVNYIPVLSGETLQLNVALSEYRAMWARWVFYDENKINVGYGVKNQTWAQQLNIAIQVPENAFYLRISFRSFDLVTQFELVRNTNLITEINSVNEKIKQNITGFVSIAHQGYSTVYTEGHNLAGGYKAAKDHGFEWGECDLKKTSDNYLVCCHDPSFVDQTTNETIVIADHTLAELKTYNYYGGTIATFEEILSECKLNGIKLAIDGIGNDLINYIFPIVRKLAMQRNVSYILSDNISYPDNITYQYNIINSADSNASLMVISFSENINHTIEFCNSIATDNKNIILYLPHTQFAVNSIINDIQPLLSSNITVAVWTVDYIPTCLEYLPYVSAICSNKTSTTTLLSNLT